MLPTGQQLNIFAESRPKIALRDYQAECIETIESKGPGRWLAQLATGLGKTVIFTNLPRAGRMLIISHREELVNQPVKYFRCPVGIERASERSGGEPVVSASVQSLCRRLARFSPDAFDTIIVDEAHHSAATSYKSILEHFNPRRVLGFTATPNRGDGTRLDDVFQEIIFKRDLRWGIEQGWLANIECLKVDVGFDLAGVRSKMGDYSADELEKAVNIEGANKAIAEAELKYGVGPTLIFAVSVAHAEAIAELIPGSVAISAATKDRADIFREFSKGTIKVIVNCMIVTEGTDLPDVQTVIMARPTQSAALYTQMVGRGTRKTPKKDKFRLIDCVGNARHDLCTAPTLLGIDASKVPARYQMDIVGDLIRDLPDLVERRMDTPKSWIRNVEFVSIWAKETRLDLKGVNWYQHADGRLSLELPPKKDPETGVVSGGKRWMKISAPDLVGQSTLTTHTGFSKGPAPIQVIFNIAEALLKEHASQERPLWSRDSFKRWGAAPASDKQKALVSKFIAQYGEDINISTLTKGEANLILKRKFNG